MRRASAAGLALAACATAFSVPATAAASPTTGRGTNSAPATTATVTSTATSAALDRYYRQNLAWGSCVTGPDDTAGRELDKAGAQCTDVTVPLDYAEPTGRTITVAMSRLKATDTRHRIGTMLLNFGGPGGPAVDAPPLVRKALKNVGARYDIIGFDPRFIGRSTPLDCGWPTGVLFRSAGPDRAGFDRQVAFQKSLADKCRATNASVLPHVTTRNTARDMDVIRGALGERKISYLGYSYGTYLGAVYGQMFPGRYDRTVLDGAISPQDYGPGLLRDAVAENEKALADWAAWAASRNSTYHFGRTRDQVLATVDRVIEAASRRPLTLGTGSDTYRVDASHVPLLLFMMLSDDGDASRAELATTVSVLSEAAKGKPTRPSPALTANLRHALTGDNSPTGSVQAAILCGDRAAPRNPESYWRNIERSRAAHPRFGPLTENITPCAFWDRPREKPTQVRHDIPALIVAATGDPRTTYRSSLKLHGELPSSRLITLEGANRHGIFGDYGNTCVDNRVIRYLATGKLPTKDLTCAK
ncbi:alpha/beta hydrolase [Streptomyces sp. ML-6]|uniref:alpha/beta hydrolase n=1 Tax=Streptomyces sp. ML-6 TaxID=2982693 RepID=UPI0024C0B785|nr:alpha/beta hydrolase [Streptomyces sp. ML-6]MDK0521308.1 alpha/beta hydrolase [Streptomyces sp. ML-6]